MNEKTTGFYAQYDGQSVKITRVVETSIGGGKAVEMVMPPIILTKKESHQTASLIAMED